MDSKNRIKQIDDLGRIVIPKDIRKGLGIHSGDDLVISAEQGCIKIRKAQESCVFCGTQENLAVYKDKCVCQACREELSSR